MRMAKGEELTRKNTKSSSFRSARRSRVRRANRWPGGSATSTGSRHSSAALMWASALSHVSGARHAQVQPPVAQCLQMVGGRHLVQRHLHSRALHSELLDEFWQRPQKVRACQANLNAPLQAACHPLHMATRLIQARQHRLRVRQERLARLAQRNAAAGALKQACAQFGSRLAI